MSYVDGYVIPVPAKNLAAYRKMSTTAGRVWMDHGAVQYVECAADDVSTKFGTPFPKLLALKKGETAVFSFIVFKSRAHRDRVNAKVMKDPRLKGDPKAMPFDMKRMTYGGFKVIVDA